MAEIIIKLTQDSDNTWPDEIKISEDEADICFELSCPYRKISVDRKAFEIISKFLIVTKKEFEGMPKFLISE